MEFMFGWPTWPFVAGLLVAMFVADEIGFLIGRRCHRDEPEQSRTVSNSLKAGVFGLVALLLGFSFSMTSGRHDMRRRLVLDEANAAGTCYLRAGLLEEAERLRIRNALRRYVGVRLELYDKALDRDEYVRAGGEMDRQLAEVWAAVEEASRKAPEATRTSQIVPAANDVIDLSGTRAWAARNHVPAPVLVLLAGCVIVTSLLFGHSSGQIGRRHLGHWTSLNVLLALVIFVILDFDRPRRGLVRVDQTPLVELQASFLEGSGVSGQKSHE